MNESPYPSLNELRDQLIRLLLLCHPISTRTGKVIIDGNVLIEHVGECTMCALRNRPGSFISQDDCEEIAQQMKGFWLPKLLKIYEERPIELPFNRLVKRKAIDLDNRRLSNLYRETEALTISGALHTRCHEQTDIETKLVNDICRANLIRMTLADMPPQMSDVVLHQASGDTCEQIAEQTTWPLGTVRSYCYRGKMRLRNALDDGELHD